MADQFTKAVTVFFGVFFLGGFAFGGIVSYGSLISTPGDNSGTDSQDGPVTLPSENYRVSQYDLTIQERRQLLSRNDVVFTSLLYNSTEERQELESMEGVESNFNGRMFVEVVDVSDTTKFITLGNTTPRAVLMSARGDTVIEDPSRQSVSSAACSNLVSWGSTASYCTQYQ